MPRQGTFNLWQSLGFLARRLVRFRRGNVAYRSFQGGPLFRRGHSGPLYQKLDDRRFPEYAVRRFERPARRFKRPSCPHSKSVIHPSSPCQPKHERPFLCYFKRAPSIEGSWMEVGLMCSLCQRNVTRSIVYCISVVCACTKKSWSIFKWRSILLLI